MIRSAYEGDLLRWVSPGDDVWIGIVSKVGCESAKLKVLWVGHGIAASVDYDSPFALGEVLSKEVKNGTAKLWEVIA